MQKKRVSSLRNACPGDSSWRSVSINGSLGVDGKAGICKKVSSLRIVSRDLGVKAFEVQAINHAIQDSLSQLTEFSNLFSIFLAVFLYSRLLQYLDNSKYGLKT